MVIADRLGSRSLSQLGAALFSEGAIQAALDLHEHVPPTAGELLVRGAGYAAAAARGFYQVSLADIAFVAAVAVFGQAEPGEGRMAEISGSAMYRPSRPVRQNRRRAWFRTPGVPVDRAVRRRGRAS